MLDQLPSEILVQIYYKSITLNDIFPEIIKTNEYVRFCLRYDVKKTWWKQQIIKRNLIKWIKRIRMRIRMKIRIKKIYSLPSPRIILLCATPINKEPISIEKLIKLLQN